jgi:predicted GIY-YIG superfamily endonuclease
VATPSVRVDRARSGFLFLLYSIYLIMHNRSGRVYIGQTSMGVSYRFQVHCRPSNACRHMARAMQKYGPDAFTCYELAHGLSKDEANVLEIALIAEHDSTRTGFNIALGGLKGRQRNVCRNGHALLMPGAMDSRNRCKVCMKKNAHNSYVRRRNDPARWVEELERHKLYKREWRVRRAALAA